MKREGEEKYTYFVLGTIKTSKVITQHPNKVNMEDGFSNREVFFKLESDNFLGNVGDNGRRVQFFVLDWMGERRGEERRGEVRWERYLCFFLKIKIKIKIKMKMKIKTNPRDKGNTIIRRISKIQRVQNNFFS